MNAKLLKENLKKNKLLFGSWQSLVDNGITHLLTAKNFEFLAIDMEHSSINIEQAKQIIQSCHNNSKPCLPRPSSNCNDLLKPLLDAGSDGIIIPMVESLQQVDEIVSNVKYPPIGNRSYGINAAQGYGLKADEYFKKWNDDSVIIVQVESKAGADNIETILKNDHIDAVMVGPYDLSGSFGVPGNFENPEVILAIKKIIKACKENHVSVGTQLSKFTMETFLSNQSLGYNFFFVESDIFTLLNFSHEKNQLLEEILKSGS